MTLDVRQHDAFALHLLLHLILIYMNIYEHFLLWLLAFNPTGWCVFFPASDAHTRTGRERESVYRSILLTLFLLSPQGVEGGSVEPWEEANYDLYKVVDRFGFLQ